MDTNTKLDLPSDSPRTRTVSTTIRRFAAVIALVLLASAVRAQTNQDGERVEGVVRFGFDGQDYNSGQTSRVGSIDATIRLLPRLTLEAVAAGGSYFGDRFGGGAAYLTMRPGTKTFLTLGGSRNSVTNTTIAWSGFLGGGCIVYESPHGAIRGLETDFNLTERGYALSPATRVLLLDPSAVFYLPRDWTLTLRAGAIRTSVGKSNLWAPSGGARLDIPLTYRLSISPRVAFDSELMDVLQIKNTSSQQYGVGTRFWIARQTSVEGYYSRVLFGAHHLASSVYGVSYALRF